MTDDPHERWAGHSVLVIPVPELNAWVRERTAFYDPSFLSDDPAFVNAHITLLGPWVEIPSEADLATVQAIAAETPCFDFVLEQVATFPDGIIYLAPRTPEPFESLTSRLAAAFPDHPPYAGAVEQVVPHLTLDQIGGEVSLTSVRAAVSDLVPVHGRAESIDLQWWANHDCHRRFSWQLGSPR